MDYSLLFIKARNPEYNVQKIVEEQKEDNSGSGGGGLNKQILVSE